MDTQESKWRSLFFTGPAVLLLFVLMVYPTLDTIRLSFMDKDAVRFVGFENYTYALTSPRMQEAFRNNLTWLIVFTALTVGLGLLIAVLTDRVKYEALAKSIIFLPMAISFVGAGVIWKFVYDVKPAGTPLQPGQQIGALNAIVTSVNPDQTLADAIRAFSSRGVPISEDQLVDTLVARETEALGEAVNAGTLTPDQADELRVVLPDRAREYVRGSLPSYREPWQTVGQWPRIAVAEINDALGTLGEGSGAVVCEVVAPACVDAIIDAEEDAIDEAVDDGRLTDDEADALLEALPDAAATFVSQGTIPEGEWQTAGEWESIRANVNSVSVRTLSTALDTGASPIDWIRTPGINNIALIIVGVWIWTGFCTVVLSASLKNIPAELFEAARVDGANEFQIFFKITIPQLMPTLTVVTTTMIITVLKVFDIVYVMTAGNFGTEVIANRMYLEMYGGQREFGHASAIAVILMLAIVPVMIYNVYQFRKQEATR